MKIYQKVIFGAALLVLTQNLNAQNAQPLVLKWETEMKNNSQLENLAHELLDQIGPRLIGSKQLDQAHNWAIQTFNKWGIEAKNEQYGTWIAWERGATSVEMISPRFKNIEATQLAWSPATAKPITAEVIAMPVFNSQEEFKAWLPKVKGKIVLMSQYNKFGRSEYQYKEFAPEKDYLAIKEEIKAANDAWKKSLEITGFTQNTLPLELEKNGAVAVALNYWTGIMGANRIFGAKTKNIPMIDISNEDYGLLYRLAQNGNAPKLKLNTQSKRNGNTPVYNTIAEIKGKEKPNEYVILSAHIDSWDGAQGATDNGTGVITVMEAARLLKKFYPNNKRTILICLWGGEEQGLNGSRAFVEDHPEIVKNTQAVFNFDSGTGRIVRIGGSGFEKSYDFLSRWLSQVPTYITEHIKTDFPGMPGRGGSDHASFVLQGAPAFMMGSENWGYGGYTWHTNKDTYDKIVFSELNYNTILAATLVYMASEEAELVDRTKRIMPLDKEGKQTSWPNPEKAERSSDYYFVK